MKKYGQKNSIFQASTLVYGLGLLYVIMTNGYAVDGRFVRTIEGMGYEAASMEYIKMIFFYCMPVFLCFGETEKYIGNYAIMQLTRINDRSKIVKNIIVAQFTDITKLFGFIFACFAVLNWKTVLFDGVRFVDFYQYIVVILVWYSVVLLQALLEVMYNSRVAMAASMGFVFACFYLGDIFYLQGMGKVTSYIFYIQLGSYAKRCEAGTNNILVIVVLIAICLVLMGLVKNMFKRKDIL